MKISDQISRADKPAINAANAVTVGRLLLGLIGTYIFVTALLPNFVEVTLCFLVAAVGLDAVDGYLARKLGCVTRFGTFADPLADKVVFGAFALGLVHSRVVPLWLVLASLLRDVIVQSLRARAAFKGIRLGTPVISLARFSVQHLALGAGILSLAHWVNHDFGRTLLGLSNSLFIVGLLLGYPGIILAVGAYYKGTRAHGESKGSEDEVDCEPVANACAPQLEGSAAKVNCQSVPSFDVQKIQNVVNHVPEVSEPVHFATDAIHGGERQWPTSDCTYALVPPVFLSASFEIRPADDAATIISRGGATFLEGEDYVYSRGGNPTERALEKRLAQLERGADAVVFSSGMAAITAITAVVLRVGDHAIVTDTCFGDTHHLFGSFWDRFGVDTSFVDTSDPGAIRNALKPNTKLIFIETPANPTLKIADLESAAQIGRQSGAKTVIDSTFASPYLQQPLVHGCDAVVHSLTKYINGHSDVLGGAVVTNDDRLLRDLRQHLFTLGAVLQPFAGFLILRGIQTLPMRMDRHCRSAMEVAGYLIKHPRVAIVYYPGLESHPQHLLARKQMRGFGGVIAFELRGIAAARNFLSRLKLCTFAVSLGAPKTLIEHPAGMTHKIMSEEARRQAGIPDGLIRLAVGLEDVRDILADLDQALASDQAAG